MDSWYVGEPASDSAMNLSAPRARRPTVRAHVAPREIRSDEARALGRRGAPRAAVLLVELVCAPHVSREPCLDGKVVHDGRGRAGEWTRARARGPVPGPSIPEGSPRKFFACRWWSARARGARRAGVPARARVRPATRSRLPCPASVRVRAETQARAPPGATPSRRQAHGSREMRGAASPWPRYQRRARGTPRSPPRVSTSPARAARLEPPRAPLAPLVARVVQRSRARKSRCGSLGVVLGPELERLAVVRSADGEAFSASARSPASRSADASRPELVVVSARTRERARAPSASGGRASRRGPRAGRGTRSTRRRGGASRRGRRAGSARRRRRGRARARRRTRSRPRPTSAAPGARTPCARAHAGCGRRRRSVATERPDPEHLADDRRVLEERLLVGGGRRAAPR